MPEKDGSGEDVCDSCSGRLQFESRVGQRKSSTSRYSSNYPGKGQEEISNLFKSAAFNILYNLIPPNYANIRIYIYMIIIIII